MEGFTDRRGWRKKDSSKKGLFWAKSPSFRGKVGNLSSRVLEMIRKFQPDWFKVPPLGEAETEMRY